MIVLACYFISFSLLGWILETVYRSLEHRRFVNPGFMSGPYLPIHGLGALLVLGIHSLSSSYPMLPVRMMFYFVGLTAIELAAGAFVERVFATRLWDYRDQRFHFSGHVCLRFSVYWMLLASILDLGLSFAIPVALALNQQFSAIMEAAVLSIGGAMLLDMASSGVRRFRQRLYMTADEETLKREFTEIAREILALPEVIALKNCLHHLRRTRLDHVLDVAWLAFKICRALSLDCRSVVRGGLLHDLYHYDWLRGGPWFHGFRHPRIALENALHITDLSDKERDIIRKHMWPLTIVPPRYPESFVVCIADIYCALKDYLMPLAAVILCRREEYRREVDSSFPSYAAMARYLSPNEDHKVSRIATKQRRGLNILLVDAQPRSLPFTFFRTLTLPRIAGATSVRHNVRILDGRAEPIRIPKDGIDVVGITFSCNNAGLAYDIAGKVKKRGIPVIAGGTHSTGVPDEVLGHFDSVLLGEAEGGAWEELLKDIERGSLRQRYQNAAPPDIGDLHLPRLDLLKSSMYMPVSPVEASRGCPNRCSFCFSKTIHASYRQRPIEQVIADVARAEHKSIFFMDDNLTVDTEYATELFQRLRPLKKHLYFQAQIGFAEEEDLVRLAAEAGCRGVFVGLESINEDSLERVKKSFNNVGRYRELLAAFDRSGILVVGGLLFGLDGDSANVFHRTIDFLAENPICSVAANMPIPYPGTKWHSEILAEGRLNDGDYRNYTGYRALVQPKRMSLEELEDGYEGFVKEFYSARAVIGRFNRQGRSLRDLPAYAALNFAFRVPRKMKSRRF